MDSFFIYYYKIKKMNNLQLLLSGRNANKSYFQEILQDKEFRNKIINFYRSEKIKQFINDYCDGEEEILLSKLPYLCGLLQKDDFWEKIMFFPLSKNKMATVENYLRIVINTHYIKYKNAEKNNEKKSILKLLLFELLIHEIFHLFRRLNYPGKQAKKALTPKTSKDRGAEKDEAGEIGKRLIYYIFGVDKIVMITYEAAKIFELLSFEKKEDIEQLKNILFNANDKGLYETAYARFCFTDTDGMIVEIQDCRDFNIQNSSH